MLVPFPPTPPSVPFTKRWSSLDERQRLLGLVDRYQVLALQSPLLARWLAEFVDYFLKEHGC